MTRLLILLLLLSWALPGHSQTLSGSQPLDTSADLARLMVDGMSAYLKREAAASVSARKPSRDRLREIIGAVDERVPFASPELVATLAAPAQLAAAPAYRVLRVRWPVHGGLSAEGLLYEPLRAHVARVVAIPDAGQLPEQFDTAQRLAAAGCQVLVPVLIDRNDTWSGNPRFRMTNQPHREFLYRMAFVTGRHVIGYEVEKVLAAVDWFSRTAADSKVGVWGYGEGGLLALYAAALDTRIQSAGVSGYFGPRESLHSEPIYRNVWSLLKDFGDAEIAGLIAPRSLVIDLTPGPKVDGPPPATPQRRGAAPGVLAPVPEASARAEFERARSFFAKAGAADKARIEADGIPAFLAALGARPAATKPVALTAVDAEARQKRQFDEMVEWTQKTIRDAEYQRNQYWNKADRTAPERWVKTTAPYRERIWNEMIGRLPAPSVPMRPRTRKSYESAKWTGYEVTLDLHPDVFSYGVLLVPKGLHPGEKRPVVVCQHGLEGRPQSMFQKAMVAREPNGRTSDYGYYQNIGERLADDGFIVYMPQNPYIFGDDFRQVQRQGNPLKLSLFSFILAHNERVLDWFATLPFADARRVGFYGLSYGGKTALRVPTLLDRYALSICSGDFNEWVVKLTTVDYGFSYMFTHEYEIDEWDLAHLANHGDMANLMAPRPFMVERGHRDGVGDDEWVTYEWAKVQRHYDEMGLGTRARLDLFIGPHRIHGRAAVDLIKQYLNWP